jgi:hypothetical protein
MAFSPLETNILRAKGLTDAQLGRMAELSIASKTDFRTIGDAATLLQLLPDLTDATATGVIAWASGVPLVTGGGNAVSSQLVVDSSDVVYCVHCKAKQPKDYDSGDLCVACGKQAEPILSCYWCASSGPGKYCRQCGAEFVATAELDLAVLLKREGLPKDGISEKLRSLTPADKDVLWGRVRKSRG